ncbi:thioesterase II family protein [Kitasatospora sp. McL0602]|uniref:thioesterase II family protein n=1 Tax=Kitasatospora sp. McL0602 TaxID=3439530 RepID=UPI003F8863A2
MAQLKTGPTRRRAMVRGTVTCPRPVPGAALRLFLFHHAGGSHLLFRDWEWEFPADWEVCLVDAPGRAQLVGEQPIDSSGELVDYLHHDLLPWLDRPFAFFGHSMGALLSYELTRRLADTAGPEPVWLGLSACGLPDESDRLGQPVREPRHELSDEDLRAWLRAVGGTPAELLENASLWRMFGPIFRSDFKLVDTWRPDRSGPPLRVPLSVFGGDRDQVVGPERLADWAVEARQYLGLHLYDGDHFYLRRHRAAVARQIAASTELARHLPLGVPS